MTKFLDEVAAIDAEMENLANDRNGVKAGKWGLTLDDPEAFAVDQQTRVQERALRYDHLRHRREALVRAQAEEEAMRLARANVAAAQAQAEASRIMVDLVTAQTEAAKAQASAAAAQTKAANANKWIAFAVGALVGVQTFFLVEQYMLAKWVADHPAPALVCPR